MEISNFILAFGLGFLWHGLQIFWVAGLPRQLKKTKPENGEIDSQRSFMLFWLDQYSWIGLTIIAIGILSLIRGLI
jgi:hypothetical protein